MAVLSHSIYDGTEDAERILAGVMKRRNWTPDVRNHLALVLEKIVLRELNPRTATRKNTHY